MDFKTVTVLLIAGFCGSLVRLVLYPEVHWKRWVGRFVVGILSAVFLGGLIGHLIHEWFNLEDAIISSAASGFIVGSAAEQFHDLVLRKIQRHDDK